MVSTMFDSVFFRPTMMMAVVNLYGPTGFNTIDDSGSSCMVFTGKGVTKHFLITQGVRKNM